MLAVEINIESKMYRLSVPIRPVIEDSLAALAGIRDNNGISELPTIQLNLPYTIRGSSDIPLISLAGMVFI